LIQNSALSQNLHILGLILIILPTQLFLTYLFILGAMVGSFLNVVIARLPAGESVVRPRSKCPKCGDMIPAWLNIPILSWVVLRGRCRACKTKISIRYPMVELLTALLFTAAATQYGQSLATLSSVIICAMLVAITFIDIDIWEIPDEISLPGIVIGCVLRPFAFDVPWYDGLIGAAMGASFLWLIRWGFFVLRDVEGMGMGDVKLIATIGAFVGPFGLVPSILIASVSGTIIGSIVLLTQKDEEDTENADISEAPLTSTNEDNIVIVPTEELKSEAIAPSPLGEATNLETESKEMIGAVDAEDLESPGGETTELDEEEETWVPPKNAVPFGPFLSLGAICTVLFGEAIQRYLFHIIP